MTWHNVSEIPLALCLFGRSPVSIANGCSDSVIADLITQNSPHSGHHKLPQHQLSRHPTPPAMATQLSRSRALASALRCPTTSAPRVHESAVRALSTTATRRVVVPRDSPNPRSLPRDPIKALKAPVVNPSDKYQSKADDLHRYGAWVMSCLPKFVQQFSVWKDELTIHICPSGVMPVFAFLKCTSDRTYTRSL